MNQEILSNYKILLGSKSPRRQELLRALGMNYTLVDIDVDEVYPPQLKGAEIAHFLCDLKAEAFDKSKLTEDSILVTADTIVWLDDECIGKPVDENDAVRMLKQLSGRQHSVYSGICLRTSNMKKIFTSHTRVSFKTLSEREINYYVDKYKPFDKAGSYGIQDWIGYVGVTGIEGCYYNVMGFPVQMFYSELEKLIAELKKFK